MKIKKTRYIAICIMKNNVELKNTKIEETILYDIIYTSLKVGKTKMIVFQNAYLSGNSEKKSKEVITQLG